MAEDFALNTMLARNSPSDEDDVFNVKTLLNRVGYYDEPSYGITPYPDGRLFQSLARFQKDHDLTPDGWMRPGGETEQAMRLVARRGRPGLIDEDFGFPSADDFALRGEVGKGHASREDDVLMAKRAMGALGKYPKRLLLDPTGIVDRELNDGLTQFQRENELYSDGWMAPNGETADVVREALAARQGKDSPARVPEVRMQVPESARVSAGTDGGDGGASDGTELSPKQRLPKEEQGSERPHKRDVLRPTQEPVDADEMYRQLRFDPNAFKGQRIEFLLDSKRGRKADEVAKEATKRTNDEIFAERLPAGRAHNNEADAFRHAYWSYRMTQEIGADAAKRFGDGHEISESSDHGERLMDLFNNAVGRQLALDPANKGRPAAEVIHEALQNGQLQISKFKTIQPEIDSAQPPPILSVP